MAPIEDSPFRPTIRALPLLVAFAVATAWTCGCARSHPSASDSDLGPTMADAAAPDASVEPDDAGWGTCTETGTSAEIEPPAAVTTLAAGTDFACALDAAGSVWCWGDNGEGQLGNGLAPEPQAVPVRVPCLPPIEAIAAGSYHACAMAEGRVWCWGRDLRGGLGFQRAECSGPTCNDVPAPLRDMDPVRMMATGRDGMCAVVEPGGGVRCWGAGAPSAEPPSTASSLSVGSEFACAVDRTGRVGCWGEGRMGQLGSGDDVMGGTGEVRQVEAGEAHACALTEDRRVHCWGTAFAGALGIGDGTSSLELCQPEAGPAQPCSPSPLATPSLGSVRHLSVGRYASCAVRIDGSVACWGTLSRQGGTPACSDPACRATPLTVQDLDGADRTAVGGSFACAILEDGSVRCWGYDDAGQLGDGRMGRGVVERPVRVVGF